MRPTAVQLLSHPFFSQHPEEDPNQEYTPSLSTDEQFRVLTAHWDSADAKETATQWRMKEEIISLSTLTTSTSAFFRLPKPVAMMIFSFLSPPDVDAVAKVCRYWNLLVQHPSLSLEDQLFMTFCLACQTTELWELKCRRWPCKAAYSAKMRCRDRSRGPDWRRLYIEGNARELQVQAANVSVTTLKVSTHPRTHSLHQFNYF